MNTTAPRQCTSKCLEGERGLMLAAEAVNAQVIPWVLHLARALVLRVQVVTRQHERVVEAVPHDVMVHDFLIGPQNRVTHRTSKSQAMTLRNLTREVCNVGEQPAETRTQ